MATRRLDCATPDGAYAATATKGAETTDPRHFTVDTAVPMPTSRQPATRSIETRATSSLRTTRPVLSQCSSTPIQTSRPAPSGRLPCSRGRAPSRCAPRTRLESRCLCLVHVDGHEATRLWVNGRLDLPRRIRERCDPHDRRAPQIAASDVNVEDSSGRTRVGTGSRLNSYPHQPAAFARTGRPRWRPYHGHRKPSPTRAQRRRGRPRKGHRRAHRA